MARREREEPQEPAIDVPHSPVNEQVVLAAAMADAGARRKLVARVRPEHFLVEAYRAAWAALQELERRGLEFDLATLQQVVGSALDVKALALLCETRPDPPEAPNLDLHVEALYWDRQRAVGVAGPLSALIEALRKPSEAPERVRALARGVAEAFAGAGAGQYLRAGAELVGATMAEMRRRVDGHACYTYGVEGLDFYEPGAKDERGRDVGGRRRMVPGAAPAKVTVLTGISGGGKSTVAARMALGFRRQGRRVLYGAWEMGSPMTLELLACMSLGWNRQDLMEGQFTADEDREIEREMEAIARDVRFMDNPFGRQRGHKESNDRNLDVVHAHVVDSGCEVFIADLWERCLASDDPSDEKRALFRQQAMAEEARVHCVLIAQQRLKDIEQRADKHPTREGIKGSSAWVDVADTILGVHRPALWKRVPDDRIEVDVLKQRYGGWPLRVEFDWDAEYGSVDGGRSVPYDQPGEASSEIAEFIKPVATGGGRRRHKRSG